MVLLLQLHHFKSHSTCTYTFHHCQLIHSGLIHGELHRYWMQNNPTNFAKILSNFILHLTARGHNLESLIPLISEAAASLNYHSKTSRNNDSNTLYIHWSYHPNGIQHQTIRHLYDNILKGHIPFDKMQVAI
jgi:hypothetical protein